MALRDVPQRAWDRVSTDLFSIQGRKYLITVDYHSTFFEVDYMPDTTAEIVVTKLKHHFARHDMPDEVAGDGGPQYTLEMFKTFSRKWGFNHATSRPGNSKSNRAAEAAVKTAKKTTWKSLAEHEDPYIVMLSHRNTLTKGVYSSLAQRLFGRRTKTLLPTTAESLGEAERFRYWLQSLDGKEESIGG